MTFPRLVIPQAGEPAVGFRANAKSREHQGEIQIMIGSLIALLGVVVYCTTTMIGDLGREPVHFRAEGLMIIGTGLTVWLFGAFKYLNALMDLGPSDDRF